MLYYIMLYYVILFYIILIIIWSNYSEVTRRHPRIRTQLLEISFGKPALLGLQVRTNAAFRLHPCTRKSGCSWWVAIVTDLVSWFSSTLAASSTTGDTTSTVDSWLLGRLQWPALLWLVRTDTAAVVKGEAVSSAKFLTAYVFELFSPRKLKNICDYTPH